MGTELSSPESLRSKIGEWKTEFGDRSRSNVAKPKTIAWFVQLKILQRILVPRKYDLQTARIMNGSFCRLGTGECRSGSCGRVRNPAGMGNFRGLAAGLAG